MIEDAGSEQPFAAGRGPDHRRPMPSRQGAQAQLRALRARPLVTIAEIEEMAEIMATHRVEEVGRAHGHFSAPAALARERLLRIGYRRRSLCKAAAPCK